HPVEKATRMGHFGAAPLAQAGPGLPLAV
ncbi:MAG: hypothetical protein ACI9QL_005444, partial [Candidatus Omnitrophota bacterium]